MYFIWYLLLGLAAGWIANLIVKGGSSGLLVNLIVGLVGGVLGGWLFSLIGLVPVGTLGSLVTAVIGSIVLLWIAALLSHRKMRWAPARARRREHRKAKGEVPDGTSPFVLSCRDSNPERQNQNLLCYHYTTAQTVARKRHKDRQKNPKSNSTPEKCRKGRKPCQVFS